MKKLISFLLVLVMVGSLAACSNPADDKTTQSNEQTQGGTTTTEAPGDDATTAEPTEENKEPVTITLYPFSANLESGTVGGWVGDYLLEKGYILDIWAYSDDKLNAMLTGGDLPDIMYAASTKVDFAELGKNGQIVNMDDYADKLPNLMNNEQMQIAMNYVREYVSGGKLYALLHR